MGKRDFKLEEDMEFEGVAGSLEYWMPMSAETVYNLRQFP